MRARLHIVDLTHKITKIRTQSHTQKTKTWLAVLFRALPTFSSTRSYTPPAHIRTTLEPSVTRRFPIRAPPPNAYIFPLGEESETRLVRLVLSLWSGEKWRGNG